MCGGGGGGLREEQDSIAKVRESVDIVKWYIYILYVVCEWLVVGVGGVRGSFLYIIVWYWLEATQLYDPRQNHQPCTCLVG